MCRIFLALVMLAAAAAARADAPTRQVEAAMSSWHQAGVASWYGGAFHNRRMSNGRLFDQWSSSAAHRTLPFGTVATVTNLANGRSERVTIEDRGPFVPGRLVDLSRGTARRLGMELSGLTLVLLVVAAGDLGPARRGR